MKRIWVQVALGAVVLAAGVILLLEALGVTTPQVVWVPALLAASAVFGFVFVAEPRSWWAALPAAALLGAAIATLMALDPGGLGQWTEVSMLGVLGAGFWAVYLRDRRHWWAIMPGGVLVTLAVLTAVTASVSGAVSGAIFLFGTALTFALVAVLPGGSGARWWAWIPAGVLAASGFAVLLSAAEWVVSLNVAWAVAVIVAGGFLIGRAIRRHVASSGR